MLRCVMTVLLMTYQAAFGLMGSAGLHAVFGVHHGCREHAISASQFEHENSSTPQRCHSHCCHRHQAQSRLPSQCGQSDHTSDKKHESTPHKHGDCWLCDLWFSISAPVELPTEVVVVLLPVADAPQGKYVAASPALKADCFIRGPPARLA